MAAGVWLRLTERHEHVHVHDAITHTRAHRHEPLTHTHAHFPDLHHRHPH